MISRGLMLFSIGISFSLLVACSDSSSPSKAPVTDLPERVLEASTTLGIVRGFEADEIVKFLGIPYAEPPVGELRFKAPEPANSWTETFEASQFGPACMQPEYYTLNDRRSEDCLTLNVWTSNVDSAQRPVMVWIHGGGWVAESSASGWYDGTILSRRGDVVVVSMEYRLGVFGFSYLDHRDSSMSGSGNVGILDQVAALEWVRDNIAKFGGDPENVTIFGESAGGMSVSTLLGIPASRDLFSKAIVQSGAANSLRGVDYASSLSDRLMEHAGIGDVANLQMITADELLAAQVALTDEELIESIVFGPVIDGVVLPEPPLDAVAAGSAQGIPLMVGTTLDETRAWLSFLPFLVDLPPEVAAAGIPYAERATELIGDQFSDTIALYSANRLQATPGDVTLALATDMFFRIPSIRLAEAQSAHQANTWMYLFTWPATVMDGFFGALHGVEVPFVFHNYDIQDVIDYIGEGAPRSLGIITQDAWLAFARSGNPNHAGMPQWPAYDIDSRATMILDIESRVEDDPFGDERMVWDGIPFNSVVPAL